MSDTRERQPVGQAEPPGPASGTVLARLVQTIRDNRLFAVALGAGAVLRLIVVIAYPGVIWFLYDSFVYLGAALRPRPDLSKTVGYSFFLRALEPFHSLTLVAVLQHLMGLAIAVMIYALARRARLPRWAATLATLPVLFDGYEVQLEHMVMGETLFTFLLMAAVTMALWRDTQAARPTPWVMLTAGLLTGYAVTVREAGAPMLVLLPAYFLVRWRGWRLPVAVAVGCALPVMAYGAWFHAVNGQYTLTRATGFNLWGRVSSFAECSQIKPPPAERAICPTQPVADRMPPGEIVWKTPALHRLPGGPVSAANNKLLTDFAIRAIVAQPLGYLGSIAHDLALTVDPWRLPYPNAYTANHYRFPVHPQSIIASHDFVPGGTTVHDVHAYGRQSPSRPVRPFSLMLKGYQLIFYTWGPLFGAIILVGLGGLIRFRRRLGGPGLLPWAAAITLLLFPMATIDFDYRYLLPVLPFACLAAVLAFAPGEDTHGRLLSWRQKRVLRARPTESGGTS
jgi:Dolichyl-phosphate-mannose-protein mannosyltransferase